MKKFSEKTALITGAGGGIGAALAEAAASRGMNLVLTDVSAEALQKTCQQLTVSEQRILASVADISDYDQVLALADAAEARYGVVDLLFNNAGIMSTGNFWELQPQTYQKLMQVNTLGIMHGTHVFLPRMTAANSDCHIINSVSLGGFLSWPMMSVYGASKAAIVSFSEAIHYELQAREDNNVTISLICPGPVKTDIFKASKSDRSCGQKGVQAAQLMDQQLNDYGISPQQLAEIAFDGIEQEQFWIFSHPDFKSEYRRRAEALLNEDIPDMALSTYGA